MDNDPTIRRSDYPAGRSQIQGMAASASHWLMDRNQLTAYEALYIAGMDTVIRVIGREEARGRKKKKTL